jgi:protein O-GlcNAc transferase
MLNVSSNELSRALVAAQGLLNGRRFAEAEELLRRVLAVNPGHPAANQMLGMVLLFTNRREPAIAAFQAAIAVRPTAEAYLNLIQLNMFSGRSAEALATAREARTKFPNDGRVGCELGRVLERAALPDEALALYERGTMLWPKVPRVWLQYGSLLFFQGEVARAVEVYRKGVARNPDDAPLHSALLYTLHFMPGMKASELLQAHANWSQRHAKPFETPRPAFANVRDPEKRLRVGYVSPNFRNHSVGRFIVPLLGAHDHGRFEIYAYSDVHTPDGITQRVQSGVDVYRQCFGMPDDALAQQIRADGIDILVDLTMHMPGGRPLLFARQAAPVQVSYLAYVGTTGLPTMQYRISDAQLDPPGGAGGGAEQWYTEKTVRVPSYWCYEAIPETPEAVRKGAGPLTLACLNNLAKVSDGALEAWGRIMRELPEAQLLLHCLEGKAREQLTARLGRVGVEAGRERFAARVSLPEFLTLHQQVDIGLDPFPYGGGTTTCDALYMGVPVVTLCDTSAEALAVGRGGASILTQVGLGELVARDVDQYVRLAVELGRSPARLAELRSTLRGRMTASPLMDAKGFARSVEDAFRGMWRAAVLSK